MADDLPVPKDDAATRLRREADELLGQYDEVLASPAFTHSVDVAVLARIATDSAEPTKERRRAAEVLLATRERFMAAKALLLGVREQSLDALGLSPKAVPHSLTQVNQRIEIVRASDWRNAPALEEGDVLDVEAEVVPLPEANGHATNGHARAEDSDAADPAP